MSGTVVEPGATTTRRAPGGASPLLVTLMLTTSLPVGVRATPADRTAAAAGLHLEDALALARLRNPDLLAARDELAQATAGERAAVEHPNPALSATTSGIHLDGLGDRTSAGNALWARSYDTVFQLGQPIERGGERRARRGAARAGTEAAAARLADVRRRLDADVVRAYSGVALADANVRIVLASAGYLRDEARIAEVRWHAGDISHSDLDQIEIAAARFELDARGAESASRQQRIALETLLGMPEPDGSIGVADSLEALVDRVGGPAPVATGGVRPDLAAAEAELRRADAAWRLTRSQRLPDPTLLVEYEHLPPERADRYGVGVAFPLPLWNRFAGEIAAARAQRDEAEHEAARTETAVAADIAAATDARDEAAARWRRYRDELWPRSESIRLSVSLAYEKGGASLLDLLEAQRGDNDVRLATMQAASDAVIAEARLQAADATITPEMNQP